MKSCCPLTDFPAGSRVRIEKLCDCPRARGRLCAMGLTPGTVVEIRSGSGGPCQLLVRGTSLSLGGGLASRVMASMACSCQEKAGAVERQAEAV